jgi:hypothetical protein
MCFLDICKEVMMKEIDFDRKLKLLLAWKETAEKEGNIWAVNVTSRHIVKLRKNFK